VIEIIFLRMAVGLEISVLAVLHH